jgi:hypothetical protein
MTIDRTIIEWLYEPLDFFENPVRHLGFNYDLDIQDGQAQASLKAPTEPVPSQLTVAIQATLQTIFDARQLLIHRAYRLKGTRVYQHRSNGQINRMINLRAALVATSSTGAIDITMTDASGRVIKDSRAERIAEHSRFIALITAAIEKHPLLKALLASYRAAVHNPTHELIHLYEIRDALGQHFGEDQIARQRLGISQAEWTRLGRLANTEPLEQGRHRGKHPVGLRPASSQELKEARAIARRLIEAFAHTL